MRIILDEKRSLCAEMQREAYSGTISELMRDNTNIVILDADLATPININQVMSKYPERSFNCGIAEANMIGISAGLSLTGKIPFAHTFAVFASRRACDQIFISACYGNTNVKIIGSDPGIGSAYNGGTHMPFEDMGILRSFPEITLLEPCDFTMTKDLTRQLAALPGVHYLRLYRKNSVNIYAEGSLFEIGKSICVRDGCDVTIISSGIMVNEALRAAEILALEGISARVLDMFTWKPLDSYAIELAAEQTGCIVTAENHNVISGLGSAVSDVLTAGNAVPLEKVGVWDEFGEVGPEDWLKKRFSLCDTDIAAAARKAINRKLTK